MNAKEVVIRNKKVSQHSTEPMYTSPAQAKCVFTIENKKKMRRFYADAAHRTLYLVFDKANYR